MKIRVLWYDFFMVFVVMLFCLSIQELQIKIITQFSVLISFFGGMWSIILVNKWRKNNGSR